MALFLSFLFYSSLFVIAIVASAAILSSVAQKDCEIDEFAEFSTGDQPIVFSCAQPPKV
jgi:hypothetical protein